MYVTDDDGFIFRVTRGDIIDREDVRSSYIIWNLELVAGKEYIAPDYSDAQGYVTPDAFVDDMQDEMLIQYLATESLSEVLADNGYDELTKLPAIYKYGAYPYQRVEI